MFLRLHMPFTQPGAEGHVQPFFTPGTICDVDPPQLQQRAGLFNVLCGKDNGELLAAVAVKGKPMRLQNSDAFTGNITQHDITAKMTPGIIDRLEVINIDER